MFIYSSTKLFYDVLSKSNLLFQLGRPDITNSANFRTIPNRERVISHPTNFVADFFDKFGTLNKFRKKMQHNFPNSKRDGGPPGGGLPNLETFMSGLPLEGAEYQPKPTSGSKVKMYFRESIPGSPAGSSSPKTSKNGILTLSCYSLEA